jgi:hypothetical protein
VRFTTEHRIGASPAAVLDAMADPDFYLDLALPDVSLPDLLAHEDDGDRATLRLRYTFDGTLDPLVRRLVAGGRVAWIQDVTVTRSAGGAALAFGAELEPRLLRGSADVRCDPGGADGSATVRRIAGELVVGVPAMGRMAERKLVPGVVRRLDVEADALATRLA